ncbi:hypothetical protein 65p229 [Aeromonas phage 65]|uniref:Lipoprotein n=2 Tax=Ishigurovirus osborne TaxID=260149 RepID=A0A219YCE1_9CAUD|nr:hypothetical protein ST65p229 [Aeromonas phage 65]ADQ53237.1 hypothetical protein 65p229 [Aeromonas phage 65]APU01612.1 hypothetical protein [Aeromonas phage 65.2]
MKKLLVVVFALFALVGCNKVVNTESFVETATVTKFVKTFKDDQRISIKTESGIELNNRNVGKHNWYYNAKKGQTGTFTITKKTYEDGKVTYVFSAKEMREFLRSKK